MNKNELVSEVSKETGLSKSETIKTIDATFLEIRRALVRKDKCQFVGFGSFEVSKRSARTGRNPRTGEVLQIAESYGVKFNISQPLKEALNKK